MSTILDALLKTSRGADKRRGPYGMVMRESPYDRRTVALEQRLIRKARMYRWAAYGVGSLAIALLGAVFYLAFFPRLVPAPEHAASTVQVAGLAAPSPTATAAAAPPASPTPAAAPAVAPPNAVSNALSTSAAPTKVPPARAVAGPGPPNTLARESPPAMEAGLAVPGREVARAARGASSAPQATSAPKPQRTAKPEVDKSQYSLQGVLWDPADPMAMVNHRAVRKGDDVDGAKVVSISEKTVKLRVGGSEFVIGE